MGPFLAILLSAAEPAAPTAAVSPVAEAPPPPAAEAVFCLAAQSAKFFCSVTSTTIGMKPCSLPHSSAH